MIALKKTSGNIKKEMKLIVALSNDGFIGTTENTLPWNLPDDLKFFRSKTLNRTVVMGRKTWESIPLKFRPLPNRLNIILSRSLRPVQNTNVIITPNTDLVFRQKNVFIIGGLEIYKNFLPHVDTLYITHVDMSLGKGILFPEFNGDEWQKRIIIDHTADERHPYKFRIIEYTKPPR